MKIKLAIVFMMVFALSIGTVSAADEDETTEDILLISENPSIDEEIPDVTGNPLDDNIDVNSDENDDKIYTIQEETGDEDILISPAAAAENETNNTVPMQTTGAPLLPLALATLLAAGGIISTKTRK